MKRLRYLLLSLFALLFNVSLISANEVYSIDIELKLDSEGNGTITEIWDAKLDKGTEGYKALFDLENSEVSNFRVMDETGRLYTPLDHWNVNGTFESKAYKSGINHTSNGLELCWGISSYGRHQYTITYQISNLIYNVDGAQVLYWRFIDGPAMGSSSPKKFSVNVSGPTYYEDTLDVWGYGNKGYAYVDNGIISMSNVEDRNFKSSEYVVLLVKYPAETFRTNNYTSKFKTFEEVHELAEQGSFKHNYNKKVSVFAVIFGIICALIPFAFWIFIFVLIIKNSKGVTIAGNYVKQEIDKKYLNNFRDIPCNKDIFKSFFISTVYKLNSKKEDLLGAILLKWLKEGQVKIIKQQKKKLFGTKEITAIDLTGYKLNNNKLEDELYDMMNKASKDSILEENELKSWCSSNYSKFFKWFDKVIEQTRDEFVNSGHITVSETGKIFKRKIYTLDNYLYEEAVKLAGLKKYLKEFSLIKEKQPIEVMLWEEYLIYAQIFGIAKEVAKQFKNLYPELIEQSNYGFNYNSIMWVDTITSSGIKSASSARSAAQSYSSGGGGFSSGGGGGGSFGGGGGGFR